MRLEKEKNKLEQLVKLDSKLPSLEELELKIEKASRELEKKDEKLEVSSQLIMIISHAYIRFSACCLLSVVMLITGEPHQLDDWAV